MTVASAAPLHASIQVGDQISLGNGIGSPGGIFIVHNWTDPSEPNFDTFCVEIHEFISFGPKYVVFGISKMTVATGKMLGPFAAWLYNGYLDGALLTPFERTKEKKVNALQVGIWQGMGYTPGEITAAIGTNYDATLLTSFQTAFAGSGWSGTGGIRIMNLKTLTGGNVQDQLVRCVPEPLSFVVWSVLAVCVGTVSARRRQP